MLNDFNFILDKSNIIVYDNYQKLICPTEYCDYTLLSQNNFYFYDRVFDMEINLDQKKLDKIKIFKRFEIKESVHSDFSMIVDLCSRAFSYDTRFFHPYSNNKIQLLEQHIRNIDKLYKIEIDDNIVGVIGIDISEDSNIISLAAIDKNYTALGLSLYCHAFELSLNMNKKLLLGTISSRNIPVINIYNFFNAKIKVSKDIFFKKINGC